MTLQFANNTLSVGSLFPLDDADLTFFNTLQTIKVTLYTASLVVVIVLLTYASITLYENRKDLQPKAKNGHWIKTILTSKMTVAIIIFVHLLFTAATILTVVLTNHAPNQSLCTLGQQLIGLFYVFALWSTYVMFVARGYAARERPLEGWKGWVAFAVHVGTACTPLLFPLGIYAGTGTFSQIACVQQVLATPGVVIMLMDTTLSMGHLLVFVFGLQRHVSLNFPKLSPTGRRSTHSTPTTHSPPTTTHSPPTSHSPRRLSCDDKTSKTSATSMATHPTATFVVPGLLVSEEEELVIRRLATKNLKLAFMSTSSTLVALAYASALTLLLPPATSPGAEYTFYVREIGQLIFLIDLFANTFALTAMSKAWQPSFLKRWWKTSPNPLCPWIRKRGVAPFESSVVSSLGGTKTKSTT